MSSTNGNLNGNLSPAITTLIRLDHSHVVAAFHRYRINSAWWRKRAVVNNVCTALEIHAQLEEEVFYPALARVAPDNNVLKQSHAGHDAMREIIGKLRSMGPENAAYDGLFMQLMRETLHHVADEEAALLPIAERSLKHELRALGAEITRRRMALLREKPLEIAVTTAGTFPVATAVTAAVLACGMFRLMRGIARRQQT
ncbi:hemerythrin domain-containing protein [Paraburkholderia phymatum]|uniref:Hemerythrin domain-containing protein n=1 Tax=Paraburkholderia phymatum TaxID=148447 RepID=A0ACC6UAA6_9BURK